MDARSNMVTHLSTAIRNLPFAFHGIVDVDEMVDRLSSDPAWVAEELLHDARVHDTCGNHIKAEVIRNVVQMVRFLI